jgi:hypothetical protein
LFYPIGIDFNALAMSGCVAKQVRECRSIADARIGGRCD